MSNALRSTYLTKYHILLKFEVNVVPLMERAYLNDIAFLRSYNGRKYKLTLLRSVRNSGVEVPRIYREKGSVNDFKLVNNISRAKSRIFEYALCNDWQYFCTFTFDGTKFDRYDLGSIVQSFCKFISNFNQRNNAFIKYLLVPEGHKDGAWHFHALFLGVPDELLLPFSLDMKIPNYIRNLLKNGDSAFYWNAYSQKFGYCLFEPIKDTDRIAGYMAKYITKDLAHCVTSLGAHLYYHSKGLNKSKVLAKGKLVCDFPDPDYENDYIKSVWLPADDEYRKFIINKNEVFS